jgi:hypothetical protein
MGNPIHSSRHYNRKGVAMSVYKYIRDMAETINDNASIATFASRKFELDITAGFVAKVRRGGQVEMLALAEYEPVGRMKPIRTNERGYDPLARALFKYHAKHTTGATKAHWQALSS